MKKRRITQCYFDMFSARFQLLFHEIAAKIGVPECDLSDHINIAIKELLHVMIHFDPKRFPQIRKGSFSSFLYLRARGQMMHEIKRNARHYHSELNENIPVRSSTDVETPVLVEELMSRLTIRERKVVQAFCDGKTLRETAADVGVSSPTVDRIRKIAISKLRKVVGYEKPEKQSSKAIC